MNKRNVKIMATIAMVLQVLAAVLGFGVVAAQKTLVPVFIGAPGESKIMAFPLLLLFIVLQLIIYIVFFNISREENNKIACIVLIILSVLLAIMTVFGNVWGNYIYSRMGARALAEYSMVTTIVSYVNTLLGMPAQVLFYIACGRYTSYAE